MTQVATSPKKASASNKPVAKSTPTVYGYLLDLSGSYHSLSKFAAESLLAGTDPDMTTGDEKIPVWKIDKDGERYITVTQGHRHVNSCVFDAVKECMQSLGIGTLTPGDKTFFVNHPRVSTDGVNKANVLGVAHGLAVAWGVGITRVFVPKLSALGDQLVEFATALGVNPLALQNYNMSNDDFISEMSLDDETAQTIKKMCRFEFVDIPEKPCVIMMSSSSTVKKSGGTTVGGQWSSTTSGVGHADFIGPRDFVSKNWKIAFQLGPLQEYAEVDGKSINRYSDINLAFDKAELAAIEKSHEKVSVWSSIVHGKSVNEWDRLHKPKTWSQSKYVKAEHGDKKNGAATQGKPATIIKDSCSVCGGMVARLDEVSYCLLCDWYEDDTERENDVSEVCPMCYGALTTDQICKNDGCGYDAAEVFESAYFICSKHKTPLYFINEGPQIKSKYVCPDCLISDEKVGLKTFRENGLTHPEKWTVQIKEFNSGKEEGTE